MKKVVVDTNVLLRFLLNDIPSQVEEARKRFKQAKLGKIELHIPQIVLFEIVFNLTNTYKFDKNKVIGAIGVILNTPYLKVQNREIFILAIKCFQENNVSFVDCFIKAMSKEIKGELFSFDKKLNKILE